jgi:CHAD domain-containing protein
LTRSFDASKSSTVNTIFPTLRATTWTARSFTSTAIWRKLRKKGNALAQLDARSRHKLRIQTKKLRYAAEFFASLFTSKRAAKRREQFIVALECFQDGLGDLNDIAVHEQRIAEIGIRSRRSNPKHAFAAGLLTGVKMRASTPRWRRQRKPSPTLPSASRSGHDAAAIARARCPWLTQTMITRMSHIIQK